MTSGIGVSSRYDDGVNRVNGREASLATIVAKLGVSALLDELAQAPSATMPARRMRGRLIRLHADSIATRAECPESAHGRNHQTSARVMRPAASTSSADELPPIGEILPEAARRFGDKVALVVGAETFSFSALEMLSNRVAQRSRLSRSGAG